VRTGVDGRLAANVDLAPTVLDAADETGSIDSTRPLDGKSLLSSAPRSMLLTEGWRVGLMPDWAAVIHAGPYYHYIKYFDSAAPWEEYYTDQNDEVNLFGANGASDGAEPPPPLTAAQVDALRTCAGTTGANPCP
jgi:arylsulfatase A-like enzyme